MHFFNAAERKALNWIICGVPDGPQIEAQLLSAWPISRRSDGEDFLTLFGVAREPRHRLARGPFVGDAWAHVRGLERGVIFLLWADEDGYLVGLEGASFGEDLSQVEFDSADMEIYPTPEGDLEAFAPPPPSWRKS
jgi:hypothetical protein